MPPKRAPLVSTATKPRPSYGTPYQIYSEVANVGKNVEGSKKRVKWRFGWSDIEKEFEVEFVHSLVTGKKTIYEDGKEIISSTSVLATEFGHSWNSENSLHIFRIEASLGMTSEHTYMFLIDGQRFVDMPRRPLTARKSASDQSSYESKSLSSAQQPRRASTNTVPDPDRSAYQSPKTQDAKTFDPFESSSDDLFQPSSAATTHHPKKSPTTASKPKPVAAPVGNLLDDDFESPAPAVSSPTPASSSFFDGFDAPKPAVAPTTSTGFSEFQPNFNSSFATTASNAPASSNHGFSMFDDAFAPTPTSANGSHASFSASVSPVAKSSASFSTIPSTTFDPFSSQPSAANTSKPARRASAQEIAQEFAGLTIAPPAPIVEEPKVEPVVIAPVMTDDSHKTTDSNTSTNSNTWDSNLVNLDLTGLSDRSKAAKTERPIRSSITSTSSSTPVMRSPPPANSLNAAMGMPVTSTSTMPNPPIGAGGFGSVPPPAMSRPTNAPVNPFASGFAISANITPTNVTRGVPSAGPSLDPFQSLPSLAGFQTSPPPKTYESVAPLSAIASKTTVSPGAPSAMSNNAMKSAPLSSAQRSQPVVGSSLDALNWKT